MKTIYLLILLLSLCLISKAQSYTVIIYSQGFAKNYYVYRFDTNDVKSNGLYIEFAVIDEFGDSKNKPYRVFFNRKEIELILDGLTKNSLNTPKVCIRKYGKKTLIDIKHKLAQKGYESYKILSNMEKYKLIKIFNKFLYS